MGEEITVKAIEIINGGTIQIDIWFERQEKGERIFVDGSTFFRMFGQAMEEKSFEWAKLWAEKNNLVPEPDDEYRI